MLRCIKGHYQPLLLLYADPRGTPVSVQDLPSHFDSQQVDRSSNDSEDSGKLTMQFSWSFIFGGLVSDESMVLLQDASLPSPVTLELTHLQRATSANFPTTSP